jgi:hypothetical protein
MPSGLLTADSKVTLKVPNVIFQYKILMFTSHINRWLTLAMDSLEFHPGRHALPFKGGLPAGRVACGCLLPLRTPHAVHAYGSR